jgi:hypothetical protein
MERRKMLKLLGLFPSLFLLSSCIDPKVPSTPTIVIGTVIDGDNMPMEGISLLMSGFKQSGVSSVNPFRAEATTDKNGKFTLSYVIPRGTDIVSIQALGSDIITDKTHQIYYQMDGTGTYTLMASPPEIKSGSYGKTTTINFQFKKR